MKCPRCGHDTNGVREGDSDYCTTCGGLLGPAFTPERRPFNVDDLVQFHICFDHPDYPGMYCVRRVPMNSIGRTIAAHTKRDSVVVTIPTTHIRAEVPVIAPIVEVWIDKRIDAGGVQRMPL